MEQKKELARIISKYDLFRDGKTETDAPFIGTLGIFHIAINKKPYLLFMAYNTKHIHLFEKFLERISSPVIEKDKRIM